MRAGVSRLLGRLCLAGLATLVSTVSAAHGAPRALPVAQARLPPLLARGPAGVAPSSMPLGWTTYLGGSFDDEVLGIAAAQGNVYVAGDTRSNNFPTTPDAAQPRSSACNDTVCDAFVAAFDTAGRKRWATYLGGSKREELHGIAADAQGNVYLTGSTFSFDFPVSAGAAQAHHAGFDDPTGGPDNYDAFVTSYDARGRVRWSTYLGGSGADEAQAIAVDALGNSYVTGSTSSSDFPVTAGAAQTQNTAADQIGRVAFVASYDSSGRLRWATYLGGSHYDTGEAITADAHGNVYLAGDSDSTDFPVTKDAAQPRNRGTNEIAFVAAYTSSGRKRWATYLGGTIEDLAHLIRLDDQGNLYVGGYATSSDFPTTPGAPQPHMRSYEDSFVASYDGQGHVRWATYGYSDLTTAHNQIGLYVGGASTCALYSLSGQSLKRSCPGWGFGSELQFTTVDELGNFYTAGSTQSAREPVTPGASQTIYGGSVDNVLVTRLIPAAGRRPAFDPASPPPPGALDARYFPATHHTLAGPYLAFWKRLGGIPTLGLPLSEPFTLAGQAVQVTERAVLVRRGSQVSLMPLSALLTAARIFTPEAPTANTRTSLYFPSTGHTLSGLFLAYWQAHQGSALLGAPISTQGREGTGDGTGRLYVVQWFTNGRLEYHPEAHDPRFRVEQGRVGYEYIHRIGLL